MYVVAIVHQHDRETEGVNNNVSKGERICYQALIIIFEVNFSVYTCSIFIGLVWATFVMCKLLPCSLTGAQTFFFVMQSALVVAVLNIKIPLEMGSLVNVVAAFTAGDTLGSYVERLSRPAVRLCALYLAQVGANVILLPGK